MATTTFDNLITFSRGSNATVTGPNGLIQWAPNNLLTFSEQFDNAGWTKNNVTITANSTVAPDGTTTADTLDEGTATANHAVFSPGATLVSNLNYAASIYLKAGTARWAQMPLVAGAFGSNAWANFDLVDGVVGNVGSAVVSATITSVGNGWYRCVVVAPSTLSGSGGSVQVGFTDNTNSATRLPSYTGTSKTVFAWGAQLELGSTATTYNNTSVRNLLGFSEAFDNAAWTKTRASIVTGAQANPVNGLFNAQKLMEDTTASNSHAVSQSFTTIVGVPYTFSTYVKAAGRNFAAVYFSGPNRGIYVNLTTGAYAGDLIAAPTSYRIDVVGSGWFRVSITATATGTTTNAFIYTANSTPDYVYTGDGNSGVYIYGAMLSNSASLDPYVPTPGAAPSSTAYYGPRFDYDPVTLLPRGFLIEEQRVNLVLRSEEFNDAAWGVSGITVTANTAVAPTGATTADTITGNSAAGAVIFPSGLGVSASATSYTASCYVKPGSAAWIVLSLWQGSGTSGVNVWFNAQTGAVGSNNATAGYTFTSASSTAVGNGWYRITVTGTVPAAALFWSMRIVDGDNAFVYTNTVGDTMFIWGAQLEAGAFATSYIPTTTSTVTRSADVATITGSLFSQWYAQPEGSFLLEYLATSDPTGTYRTQLQARNTGATSYSQIRNANLTPTTAVTNNQVVVGGVTQADLPSASLGAGAVVKTTLAYRTNDFSAVTNGATPVTDTSGSVASDIALLAFNGGTFSAGQTWFRSIRYVPVRAADFQLQQVTT